MEESVNRFIKHAIVNLEKALELDDPKIKWAVLKNLSDVVESYVEAMQDELELV
jgi:hypothetical protein